MMQGMNAAQKTVFPAQFPASESDSESIRANDWAAFRQLSDLADHWTLKAWPAGKSGLYWYLTLDDPKLLTVARHCQDRLGADGMDPVPLDGLHITVLGIGDAVNVPVDDLDKIVDRAGRELSDFTALDLDIGPLSGSRSAIRFSVAPWDRLLELHRILHDCAKDIRPDQDLRGTADYRPHLGIAYINTARPAAELIDRVRELREMPPVAVTVGYVKLVELWRAEGRYRWREQAVIPLPEKRRER